MHHFMLDDAFFRHSIQIAESKSCATKDEPHAAANLTTRVATRLRVQYP
jgi:hypothetical protein